MTTLDDRKSAILRAIVEGYVRTAQPVGSTHIVESGAIPVSAATIRNEMVALEREGFLHQPHTSAGRVPTEKGYRFFVDHLEGAHLSRVEDQTVREFFNHASARVEQLLADTSRLLAGLTKYAAVVVGAPHDVVTVRSVQLVRLNDHLALVLAVLSDGSIERGSVDLDEDTADAELEVVAGRLSAALVGGTLSGADEPAPSGDPRLDALVGSAFAELRRPEPGPLYVGGVSSMASAFDATAQLRDVLSVLEEQYLIVSLIRDVLERGMQVAIGSETGVEPLADCSLVVAPYTVDGLPVGSIGVLGPTRMNYPQALAAVAVVSRQLGRHLSQV
jgi:heat-inducible transcriptional repressor